MARYIHGHGCTGGLPLNATGSQPTLLYTSEDGVSWELRERFRILPKNDLFYFTTPVRNPHDGHYYALARVNPPSADVVLCRSASPGGPFERGPSALLRGPRHLDLHYHDDTGTFYVWYSMIGDAPERILLGSIDATMSSGEGEEDWRDWRFLPGPRILHPEYWYEHGNTPVATSREGTSPPHFRHQLADPRFLPDDDNHDRDSGDDADAAADATGRRISGRLFYAVQGEKGIASARISIDLALYHDAVSHRHHANIVPEVLNSTSLPWDVKKHDANGGKEKSFGMTQMLITGVGRTGTTGVCTLFQKLGIMVSHDNNVDCGPYPGPDGAVSWYDAFTPSDSKRYEYVLHLVRDPLKTINSRIVKCERQKGNFGFMRAVARHFEEFSNDDTCASYSLKHWVRRNSFVESHASWRVQSEAFFSEQLSVWETCMAANFGTRCPDLSTIETRLREIPLGLNSLYASGTISKVGDRQGLKPQNDTTFHSWESLEDLIGEKNYKYIQIAQDMAHRYGYDADALQKDFTPFGYDCKFTRRDGITNKNWDCFVGSRAR